MSRSCCARPATRQALRRFTAAGVGLALAFLCALVVLPGCGKPNCPETVSRYECVGWIAPVCGWYCYRKGTDELILSDCCGSGGGKPGLLPTAPGLERNEDPAKDAAPWAPPRAFSRYDTRETGKEPIPCTAR